jgi:hypothetical protein
MRYKKGKGSKEGTKSNFFTSIPLVTSQKRKGIGQCKSDFEFLRPTGRF